MYVGNAQRFAVKITPAKASKAKLGWKTSNKKIAKVTKKGVIKALKKGKCKITVKTSDGKKKVIIVKVIKDIRVAIKKTLTQNTFRRQSVLFYGII